MGRSRGLPKQAVHCFEVTSSAHRCQHEHWAPDICDETSRCHDADRYRERSPVTHASEIRIPVLMLQGDGDPVVPPAQALAVVEGIRAAGGTVEHHVYEGEAHGFTREDTVLDVYARMETFLRTRVLEA